MCQLIADKLVQSQTNWYDHRQTRADRRQTLKWSWTYYFSMYSLPYSEAAELIIVTTMSEDTCHLAATKPALRGWISGSACNCSVEAINMLHACVNAHYHTQHGLNAPFLYILLSRVMHQDTLKLYMDNACKFFCFCGTLKPFVL